MTPTSHSGQHSTVLKLRGSKQNTLPFLQSTSSSSSVWAKNGSHFLPTQVPETRTLFLTLSPFMSRSVIMSALPLVTPAPAPHQALSLHVLLPIAQVEWAFKNACLSPTLFLLKAFNSSLWPSGVNSTFVSCPARALRQYLFPLCCTRKWKCWPPLELLGLMIPPHLPFLWYTSPPLCLAGGCSIHLHLTAQLPFPRESSQSTCLPLCSQDRHL